MINIEALNGYVSVQNLQLFSGVPVQLYYSKADWFYTEPYFFNIMNHTEKLCLTLFTHIRYYANRHHYQTVMFQDILNPNKFQVPAELRSGKWYKAANTKAKADIINLEGFVLCIKPDHDQKIIVVQIFKQ